MTEPEESKPCVRGCIYKPSIEGYRWIAEAHAAALEAALGGE